MDFFGIGAAMKSVQRIYFQSARGSGRTSSMIESLKPGDRVIFANQRERDRVENMCKERGITYIKLIVIEPKEPNKIFEHGISQGRTIFDHRWVEHYYLNAVERAEADIDHLQRESSGFGEVHLETRRKAYEIVKWEL